MICACCGKPKGTISPKKSDLIGSVTLLVCDNCAAQKFEPRHLIIIVGRSKGIDSVKEYIKKRRYVGLEITAAELTV